jgi:hypothetical protein
MQRKVLSPFWILRGRHWHLVLFLRVHRGEKVRKPVFFVSSFSHTPTLVALLNLGVWRRVKPCALRGDAFTRRYTVHTALMLRYYAAGSGARRARSHSPRNWLRLQRPGSPLHLFLPSPRTPLSPHVSSGELEKFSSPPHQSLKRPPLRSQMEERRSHSSASPRLQLPPPPLLSSSPPFSPPHLVTHAPYPSTRLRIAPLVAPESASVPPHIFAPLFSNFALIFALFSTLPETNYQLPWAARPRVQRPPLPTRLHRPSLTPPRLASSSASSDSPRGIRVHARFTRATPSLYIRYARRPRSAHGVATLIEHVRPLWGVALGGLPC